MAIKDLTAAEIDSLVGTRHATGGFEYPSNGLQPYYQWLVRALHLLGESSAGGLRVSRDDASATQVIVAPGRANLRGAALSYAGGTFDLAAYNNDTAYLWLYDNSGQGDVTLDADSAGWPTSAHIKLAEVSLAAGQITDIVDRRLESAFHDDALSGELVHYELEVTTQGDTGSPSEVTITPTDLYGADVGAVDYLRVRICDADGYADATNATIAAGTNTTVLETITTDKDLVLKSHTDGTFKVDLTDATAETVTLRIGPPPLTGRRADHSPTLDVTHA